MILKRGNGFLLPFLITDWSKSFSIIKRSIGSHEKHYHKENWTMLYLYKHYGLEIITRWLLKFQAVTIISPHIGNALLHFRYHLSLEKGVVLHFQEFKIRLVMDVLCQVWLKFAKFLKVENLFWLFCYYFHFKGQGP